MSEEEKRELSIGYCPHCGEDWEGIIERIEEGSHLLICRSCDNSWLITNVTGKWKIIIEE